MAADNLDIERCSVYKNQRKEEKTNEQKIDGVARLN